MIVATFNVENLFERPRAMNLPKWSEGQPALNAASELNALFNRRVYTARQQRRMLHLLKKFGLLAARSTNTFLTLRTVRGALIERKKGKAPRIVATGRDSWAGWIELKREPIADAAIANTCCSPPPYSAKSKPSTCSARATTRRGSGSRSRTSTRGTAIGFRRRTTTVFGRS